MFFVHLRQHFGNFRQGLIAESDAPGFPCNVVFVGVGVAVALLGVTVGVGEGVGVIHGNAGSANTTATPAIICTLV